MKFRVLDNTGKDVTNTKSWYVSPDGDLYFVTDEIDSPLKLAEDIGDYVVVWKIPR